MKRLILVRHAHVPGIEPATWRGRSELDLSAEGRGQLPLLAAAARAWRPVAVVAASPRRRARDTASAIAGRVGGTPQVLAALDDIDYGHWTGRGHAEVAAGEPEAWQAWQRFPARFRFPAGESLLDVQARAASAMEELVAACADAYSVVVVSHDSVIRVLLAYLMSAPLESYRRWRIDPASLTTVEFDGGQAALAQLNEVAHLRAVPHSHATELKESV